MTVSSVVPITTQIVQQERWRMTTQNIRCCPQKRSQRVFVTSFVKDELVIFKVSSFDRSELNRHVVNVVKRSQRGFRVVIGEDNNLKTTLSSVHRWQRALRGVICGTGDNVVSKLSSSPMTTLKPRCDLFTDHNVSITYASDVDTRRYNVVSTLNPYLKYNMLNYICNPNMKIGYASSHVNLSGLHPF